MSEINLVFVTRELNGKQSALLQVEEVGQSENAHLYFESSKVYTNFSAFSLIALASLLGRLDEAFAAPNSEVKLISLHLDSSYLFDGLSRWVQSWEKNGWLTRDNTPVKMKNLWQKVYSAVKDNHIHLNFCHERNPRIVRCLAELDRASSSHQAEKIKAAMPSPQAYLPGQGLW